MAWWLIRLAGAVLVGALSAGLGGLIGALTHHALPGLLAGGALGVFIMLLRDGLRSRQLLAWLRGPLETAAPRDSGFWGELGYRIEKALRSREQSVQQERERLAQFLSAIEASPNGVLMLDAGDHIEWFNSVAAEHFGLDPHRDLKQRVTNLVRMPVFVAHLQGERFDENLVFPGPAGKTTLSVLVRRYGEGSKLVLSQDITERERTEAMRRSFVANVSHEIRTPLTVVAGFVETLAQLPLTEVERQRVLGLMAQQTDRMQALVADLLTLAQLEGSPRPTAERWVDVDGLFRKSCAEARALSGGRHAIEVDGVAEAEIAGSESELQSAVTNLLNNAVRYTPEGGRISVRWTWRGDGGAELAVADSGIGIAREHLARLTERFYRVDGSRSRDTGGTGLGLSIVKHVVQRHGGAIEIDSEPGQGSTFKLVLPAVRLRHLAAVTA